ncbi:MAG: hypothetical protein KDA69_10075 [Planctomycetaceae bacterium]|nr:hypothetical protein [Planctomycetaceae bacterium]MCA9044656.1 hypothetical protein [Planctomycetaceae bacterium]
MREHGNRKVRAKSGTAQGLIGPVGGFILCVGAYLAAVFVGLSLHPLKNGPGDGSMPTLATTVPWSIVGLVLLGIGFGMSYKWLFAEDKPVGSLELFSVLICDPIPMLIGLFNLARGFPRGARLLLTHALILFIKLVVAALAWNPNL